MKSGCEPLQVGKFFRHVVLWTKATSETYVVLNPLVISVLTWLAAVDTQLSFCGNALFLLLPEIPVLCFSSSLSAPSQSALLVPPQNPFS